MTQCRRRWRRIHHLIGRDGKACFVRSSEEAEKVIATLTS
jgi:hypothetical protein